METVERYAKKTDVEVVGTKTHEALVADWRSHFEANVQRGRPSGEGWMTVTEMSAECGAPKSTINDYLSKHEANYEKKEGTFESRRTTYYRFKGKSDFSD